MIVLFTDYGHAGPYLGEVEAQLFRYTPTQRVVNLMADVPRHDVKAGAYLLSALEKGFPNGTIFFCVVDPGVGTGNDTPVIIRLGEHRFVGPHNGLFDIVTRYRLNVECWEITWQPPELSSTFHGRDLYAPVCAMLANQQPVPGRPLQWSQRYNWPDDLYEVIYMDGFGNAWTGIRASELGEDVEVLSGCIAIRNARTFGDVKPGDAFWYENSSGLVEIAVNLGSAAESLELTVGSELTINV